MEQEKQFADVEYLKFLRCGIIRHEKEIINSQTTTQCRYFGYVVCGSGTFYTDDYSITVNAGEIVYIPKGCVYRSEWKGAPYIEFYSAQFDFEITDSDSHVCYPLQKIVPQIDAEKFFESLQKHLSGQNADKWQAVGDFYKTYPLLMKRAETIKKTLRTLKVTNAVNYLKENYDKDVKIEFLADLCHLSPSRFFAVFKDETGITPTEYKNIQRASAAVALIISTSLTLEQICERLNICSPAYLRRILFKYAGTTPKTIKNNISKL